jgi:hypothetical protein
MLCLRLVRAGTRAKGFSANFSANILLRRNACQVTFMMMGRASQPLAASDAQVAAVLAGDSEAFACSIVSNAIVDSPFKPINRSKDTLLSFAFLCLAGKRRLLAFAQRYMVLGNDISLVTMPDPPSPIANR